MMVDKYLLVWLVVGVLGAFRDNVDLTASVASVGSIDVIDNAEYLVSGSDSGVVSVYRYDGLTIAPLQQFQSTQHSIVDTAINNNCSIVVSVNDQPIGSAIRIYLNNTKTIQLMQNLSISTRVSAIELTADATRLFVITDNHLIIYAYLSKLYQLIQQITVDGNLLRYLSISDDGKTVALATNDSAYIYQQNTTDQYIMIGRLTYSASINSIHLTNSMSLIVGMNQVIVYNLKLEIIQAITQLKNPRWIDTSRDGKLMLVVNGNTPWVYKFNSTSNKYEVADELDYSDSITSMGLDGLGKFLVLGGDRGLVRIYFECQRKFCSRCRWSNKCGVCNNGFKVVDNELCICAEGKSISKSAQCVRCQLSACNRCDVEDICAECDSVWDWDQKQKKCYLPFVSIIILISEGAFIVILVLGCIFWCTRKQRNQPIQQIRQPLND